MWATAAKVGHAMCHLLCQFLWNIVLHSATLLLGMYPQEITGYMCKPVCEWLWYSPQVYNSETLETKIYKEAGSINHDYKHITG